MTVYANKMGERILKMRSAMVAVVAILLLTDLPSPGFAQSAIHAQTAAAVSRVEPQYYHSTVFGIDRKIFVYVPAGYDLHPDEHYPVLYLRHGGGGDATEWLVHGDAQAILDGLIANHQAAAMIVVFTSGEMPASWGSAYDARGLTDVGGELMNEVVPLVQSKYRASSGGANRAIAGLSMGAGQSFAIGQTYANDFSAMGIFSAGTFGIVRASDLAAPNQPTRAEGLPRLPALRPFDPARDARIALADAAGFNRSIRLLYISVGDQDPRAGPTAAAIKIMRDRGLRIVAAVQHGKHEWSVWKVALADFVPRLFGE